ncbi:MAG: hypothetical protein ACOYD0_07445 [Candidatus Nanopelagicales bacterium]
MGNQPSPEEMAQLEKALDELCDLGYWPAHKSLANLCGKRIWAALDWGDINVESASPQTRSRIIQLATTGLLHLDVFREAEGTKIDPGTLANVDRYRQEFTKYIRACQAAS